MQDDDSDGPGEPSAMPFVVALVGVAIVAVLAFVYLREDPGELLRPDRITAIDDDTVRAVAADRPGCERVLRAQVDMAEEAVFIEFVAETADDCADDAPGPLDAEVTLPEPIGDRPLRAGVGRFRIPCQGRGQDVTCTPDR